VRPEARAPGTASDARRSRHLDPECRRASPVMGCTPELPPDRGVAHGAQASRKRIMVPTWGKFGAVARVMMGRRRICRLTVGQQARRPVLGPVRRSLGEGGFRSGAACRAEASAKAGVRFRRRETGATP
jgi:hypothetical protein